MANDVWHLWCGKKDKLNCVAHSSHSWFVLSMGSVDPTKVDMALHMSEGDQGKDAAVKMYGALTQHLQKIGLLPPVPMPLPPQEPEEEIIQVEVLLPKKE